jgi:hypothetical protein
MTLRIPQNVKDEVDKVPTSDQGSGDTPGERDTGAGEDEKLQEEIDLANFEKELDEGLAGDIDIDSGDET